MGIGHEVRRLSASHLDAVRLLAWSTLPARPTSFVGRTDECAQVVAAGFDSRHQSWPKFDHVHSRDLDLAGADVDALEVAWRWRSTAWETAAWETAVLASEVGATG